VADLLFIVSRTEPKRYMYLKHVYADEHRDVVPRPSGRRTAPKPEAAADRATPRGAAPSRHHGELQSLGWALVSAR